MKANRIKPAIFIIPALVMAWGIFNLSFFDPFFAKSSDPEFPYLVNGLNCALLKFNYIGHYDHPGTPFQIFIGIVIRFAYLISGKEDLAQDVFARPEYYLNASSMALTILQALLITIVGWLGLKRKISVWQILLLQSGFIFNDVLFWLFARVNPDRFFMISGLLFVIVFLKHGYESRSSLKFAVYSGIVMALGLATKFNYLPVLLLPLFLIETNKNRLVYIGSGIASFFAFIAPIITKFDDYFRFLTGIFKHDGLYGGGESKVLNLDKMLDSFTQIFKLNPELVLLIALLAALAVIAFKRKEKSALLFTGFLLIILVQIVMVSKHFKNYYLAPTFILYGFMFFMISGYWKKITQSKSQHILVCNLLPVLFILSTAWKVQHDFPIISEQKKHRELLRQFTDKTITTNDFLFIEPTWLSGPFKENAIVYGLSYCGHRDKYVPQLTAVNPNVITYEGNDLPVKLWRGMETSLDSVAASGKNIFIYSSPERNASVLKEMLVKSAERNKLQLAIDTVYGDKQSKDEIIQIKATNSQTHWTPLNAITESRQIRINRYIETIKNTPNWLEKVKKKAVEKNIPLDSMIKLDAIWMADQNN